MIIIIKLKFYLVLSLIYHNKYYYSTIVNNNKVTKILYLLFVRESFFLDKNYLCICKNN